MPEFKACPFCGTIPNGDIEDIIYPVGKLNDLYKCVCSDPDCGGSVLGWDQESAIMIWNNRPSDDEYNEKIENLEISNEVQSDYMIILREKLDACYSRNGVVEQQLSDSLERQFELEMKQ